MNANTIRLVLTEAQSAILADHGSDHFILVHKPCRTEEPTINMRWCITLAPISHRMAKDVASVICGTATVRRTSKATTASLTPANGQPA